MTCRDLWTYNCISLHIWFCPSVPQHPNLLSPAVDWGCGRNHSEFTWNIHLHMILKSSSSSKNRKLFMVFSFSPFFSAYAGSTSSNYSPSCSCFGIKFYPNNPFQKRQYGPLCLILWASSVGLQWPWFPPASNWWSRWINWFWSSEDKTLQENGRQKKSKWWLWVSR